MKINIRFGISALLAAMLLVSLAFVPAVSASTDTSKEQQMPDELKQWIEDTTVDEATKLWRQEQTKLWEQNHTVNVTLTKVYRYEKGNLEIKEIYSGEDIEVRFDAKDLTNIHKISVDSKTSQSIFLDGEIFSLEEGNEKVVVTEKTTIMTTSDEPFQWWVLGYEYPRWTWKKLVYNIYVAEDPINIAWESTDKNTVKSRILSKGWDDCVVEYRQYVCDRDYSWLLDTPVADDTWRLSGGNHARIWELSNNDVVASAHHDKITILPPGHEADKYETAEDLVAGFFDNDLNNWWVLYDNRELDNEVGDHPYTTEPCNDGEATCIYKVGS